MDAHAERIALLIMLAPRQSKATHGLTVVNALTNDRLTLNSTSFVLTLERDSDVPVTRGHLRSLSNQTSYPIQSNAAFFEALEAFLSQSDASP